MENENLIFDFLSHVIESASSKQEAYARFGAAIDGMLQAYPDNVPAEAIGRMRLYQTALTKRLLKGD